jgi:hypothetical protein
MRRLITAALISLLLLGTGDQGGRVPATEATRLSVVYARSLEKASRGPCDEDRYDVKPTMGPETVHRKVKALIRCVARRWSVEGGAAKAVCVAGRESGWWPWAHNGSSKGLFQHVVTYWADRVDRWLRAEWFWQLRDDDPATYPSVLNARAQSIVTARMVHAGGWGPWRATERYC